MKSKFLKLTSTPPKPGPKNRFTMLKNDFGHVQGTKTRKRSKKSHSYREMMPSLMTPGIKPRLRRFKNRKISLFGPPWPPLEISKIRNFAFWGCQNFAILEFLKENFVSLALRRSNMGNICVLDAFGVDLEKSKIFTFWTPRDPPCKSRKSEILHFGVFEIGLFWSF